MIDDIIFLQNYGSNKKINEMVLAPEDFSEISIETKNDLAKFAGELIKIIKKAIRERKIFGRMRPEQCLCDLRVIESGSFEMYVEYLHYGRVNFECCFNNNDGFIHLREMEYVNYLFEQTGEGIRFELGNLTKYPISYRIIVTRLAPKKENN